MQQELDLKKKKMRWQKTQTWDPNGPLVFKKKKKKSKALSKNVLYYLEFTVHN